jgi:hypothetical protein
MFPALKRRAESSSPCGAKTIRISPYLRSACGVNSGLGFAARCVGYTALNTNLAWVSLFIARGPEGAVKEMRLPYRNVQSVGPKLTPAPADNLSITLDIAFQDMTNFVN